MGADLIDPLPQQASKQNFDARDFIGVHSAYLYQQIEEFITGLKISNNEFSNSVRDSMNSLEVR